MNDEIKAKIDRLSNQGFGYQAISERGFVLDEWNEEAWIAVVESVTVTKDNKLIFAFKDGSKTAVSI